MSENQEPAASDVAVILPAAGRGRRFGGDKLTVEIDGLSVFARSVAAFLFRKDVVAVVVPTDRQVELEAALPDSWWMGGELERLHWCGGGAHRADSVRSGLVALQTLDVACDLVAVHDAARPLVPADLIDRAFDAARRFGASVPGLSVTDTIKRTRGGFVEETLLREELVAVQTPQVARRDWMIDAFLAAGDRLAGATDDVQVLEWAGRPVAIVQGDARNLKVTRPEDLARAASLHSAATASTTPTSTGDADTAP